MSDSTAGFKSERGIGASQATDNAQNNEKREREKVGTKPARDPSASNETHNSESYKRIAQDLATGLEAVNHYSWREVRAACFLGRCRP